MGLLGAIIVALIISTPLRCQRLSRQNVASLVQNLLASNPQVLKTIANRQLRSPGPNALGCSPFGIEQTIGTALPGQYVSPGFDQRAYVQRAPCPVAQAQIKKPCDVPCQNYPVAQAVPVNEAHQVQAQYPVTQQVQTVSQTYTAPVNPAPQPYLSPASMVNPFLPAASPISALFPPTSGLLPPANPNSSKSVFLRRIPIPPPCM